MIRNGPASPGQLAWVDLGAKDPAAARAFYGALLGWTFLCWVEVYSRDGERARDFYAKLLGLEWQKLEGLPYWPLKRGEEIVCGTMQMPCHYPADLPSHWNVYFAVEDVDASVAKLVSLGGTQISPPFDSPFGRLAFVTDTAGARFNLMTPVQGG
jgi:predicted enzyme related to lactoylglutathione lyase